MITSGKGTLSEVPSYFLTFATERKPLKVGIPLEVEEGLFEKTSSGGNLLKHQTLSAPEQRSVCRPQ